MTMNDNSIVTCACGRKAFRYATSVILEWDLSENAKCRKCHLAHIESIMAERDKVLQNNALYRIQGRKPHTGTIITRMVNATFLE